MVRFLKGLLLALCVYCLNCPWVLASSYGDINITDCVPGTSATKLGKAEDAGHSNGDTGVAVFGVANPSAETALSGATADYTPIGTTTTGRVLAQVEPSIKTTYMGCTGFFTAAASATDIFEMLGSASKTVKIQKVFVAYDSTTSGNTNRFFLKKISAAGSGGTSAATTMVPLDSSNAAATATAKHYTANPTIATVVGNLNIVTTCGNSSANAAAGFPQITLFDADKFGQPIVLRGTTQGIVVNNNGVTIPNTSPQVSITVVFTEE